MLYHFWLRRNISLCKTTKEHNHHHQTNRHAFPKFPTNFWSQTIQFECTYLGRRQEPRQNMGAWDHVVLTVSLQFYFKWNLVRATVKLKRNCCTVTTFCDWFLNLKKVIQVQHFWNILSLNPIFNFCPYPYFLGASFPLRTEVYGLR